MESENYLCNMMKEIPYHEFGGRGNQLHFAHANGFPPESYTSLLHPIINEYKVNAILLRPLWKDSDPDDFSSWKLFAEDLILFFDKMGYKNIIGIGHSLGAVVSLIAAIKNPRLFSKLVLIEPVLMPKWITTVLDINPMIIKKHLMPVSKAAINRREYFDSHEAMFQSYRTKKIFQDISDKVLKEYIFAAVSASDSGGLKLRYSKEWESKIYCTIEYVLDLFKQIQIPVLVLRGENTNVISKNTWNRIQSWDTHIVFKEYKNKGHLLPFEAPEQCAIDILEFLKE